MNEDKPTFATKATPTLKVRPLDNLTGSPTSTQKPKKDGDDAAPVFKKRSRNKKTTRKSTASL